MRAPGRAFVEASPEGLLGIDARDRVEFANPAALVLAPQLVEGAHVLEALAGEPFEAFCAHYSAARTDSEARTWRASWLTEGRRRERGGWMAPWMEDGQRHGTLVQLRDLDHQLSIEQGLAAEYHRLTSILEGTRAGAWEWHVQTGEMRLSEAWARMIGYSAVQLAPHSLETWRALTHPADLAQAETNLARHLGGVLPAYEAELRMLHRDGHWVWILARGKIVSWLPDGRPGWLAGVHLDISHRMDMQAQLRASEELFRTVVDGIPDPVFLKDKYGAFVLGNRALAELYGTTPEALVGKTEADFGVAPELAHAMYESGQRVMASGEQQVMLETSHDVRSGALRHYQSIKKPIGRDRLLVVAQDITDVIKSQRRATENVHRYQQVLTVTHEAIWEWNLAAGRIEHNDQWYAQMGRTRSEVDASLEGFLSFVHPDDRPFVEGRIRELVEGRAETYQSEHRLLHATEGVVWVKDRGQAIERDAAGMPLRLIGSCANVTAERLALEESIKARELAEEANRAKSRFLASMSHELRTPLNGILGMAQVLSDSLRDETNLDAARTILTSGQALLTMLNDVLDLAKIEAGKMEFEARSLDASSVLKDVARLFSDTATAKGNLLVPALTQVTGHRFVGDPSRLQQMLSNLVSNAIKFTENGRVELGVEERAGDETAAILEFWVQDTGEGIPPEKIPRLFHPFTQADASTGRRFGGTGLGLSIVRSMAEAMGGSVGVESTVGAGSRFWFRVPLRRKSENTPSGLWNPAAPMRNIRAGVRIVAAEDNPINRKVLGALLGKMGIQVSMVEDGAAAVAALTTGNRPDLVLMDCQMPELDGLEATRRIRAWEVRAGVERLPIIALTAGAYEADRSRCLEAGMDDFLTKPLQIEALMRVLASRLPDRDQAKAKAS